MWQGKERSKWNASAKYLGAVLASSVFTTDAVAAEFASRVVSYNPTGAQTGFQNASAAVGRPQAFTADNPVDPFFPATIISPFNPPFQPDEIVSVGEGGQITLELSRFARNVAGPELGIFSNVGLADVAYPNGTNSNPASTFGAQRPVTVEVSRNGVDFVTVSSAVTLEQPVLYYANAGPYAETTPANPIAADFGIPFGGTLSSFGGKNFAETVALFNTANGYSAGGTWIDFSSTGLDEIAYVRLSLPDNGDSVVDRFNIDAVSVANGAVGAAVPEPGSLALGVVCVAMLSRRRRG